MKLKAFSQLPYAEKGIIDDCGPSSLAAAIYHSSQGTYDPGVRGCIDAAAKAGRVDRFGKSDGTTFAQIVAAAKILGASATIAKNWNAVVAAANAGQATLVAFLAPTAIPTHALSAWQRGNAKRHPGHTYRHLGCIAKDGDQWYFADPTLSGKGPEEFGKPITEAEAKTLATWGIDATNAKRTRPMAWIVKAKPRAIVQPVVAGARVAAAAQPKAVEPTRGVQLPAASTTPKKETSAVDTQLAALGRVNFAEVGGRALEAAQGAAAAASHEKGSRAKVIAFLTYIKDHTGLDEAALEFARTFLTVSISVALGLGIPLLDINGGDFRTVISAGLASGLQVIVKFLDPKHSAFGVKE